MITMVTTANKLELVEKVNICSYVSYGMNFMVIMANIKGGVRQYCLLL